MQGRRQLFKGGEARVCDARIAHGKKKKLKATPTSGIIEDLCYIIKALHCSDTDGLPNDP